GMEARSSQVQRRGTPVGVRIWLRRPMKKSERSGRFAVRRLGMAITDSLPGRRKFGRGSGARRRFALCEWRGLRGAFPSRRVPMEQLINLVVQKTGVSADAARGFVLKILGLLKDKLPE